MKPRPCSPRCRTTSSAKYHLWVAVAQAVAIELLPMRPVSRAGRQVESALRGPLRDSVVRLLDTSVARGEESSTALLPSLVGGES